MTATVNQILSILAIIGQIFILALILSPRAREILSKHALVFTFLIALIATSGSLFYSEIAGYEPCNLCWYQRILMYPMVFLLLTAIIRRDQNIFKYTFVLSLLGVFLAGYHYLLQIGAVPEIPCSAVGYSASCAQRFVMTYGYITLPMMSLTAVTSLIKTKEKRPN